MCWSFRLGTMATMLPLPHLQTCPTHMVGDLTTLPLIKRHKVKCLCFFCLCSS